MVPELAREIERARVEAGLSHEELLTNLREQRERTYAEYNLVLRMAEITRVAEPAAHICYAQGRPGRRVKGHPGRCRASRRRS